MNGIKLSIDPLTLNQALGRKRVEFVEQDGDLTYETRAAPGTDFSKEVERVWTEYPDGLLDVTEDALSARSPDAHAVTQQNEVQGQEEKENGRMMTWEELEDLRADVFTKLNDARNEMWFVLELAKTLGLSSAYTNDPPLPPNPLASAKKHRKPPPAVPVAAVSLPAGVEPPILPPGTFSATSTSTSHPQWQTVHDMELAMAAKQDALDECLVLVDDAVAEMRSMAEANERFWDKLRTLRDGKDGQWAIVPRPDFGKIMAEGEKAKDVIIPYALDEANPGLRGRSLAAFDLDPNKIDSLTFGARSHLRLRVAVSEAGGRYSSTPPARPDENNVEALMAAVQQEAADEELFNELRLEAARNDSVIEPRRISSKLGGAELEFELWDSRDDPPSSEANAPLCDFILDMARLLLLRIHRSRKARLLDRNISSIITAPILAPLLHGLSYLRMSQRVMEYLCMFEKMLSLAGIPASVSSDWAISSESGDAGLQDALGAGDLLDCLKGNLSLAIKECVINLALDPRKPVAITTSMTAFNVNDVTELPSIIADDLSKQLLEHAELSLTSVATDELKQSIFLDGLDNAVVIGDHGTMSLSIPPPFSSLHARFDGFDGELKSSYASSVTAGPLSDWLEQVLVTASS